MVTHVWLWNSNTELVIASIPLNVDEIAKKEAEEKHEAEAQEQYRIKQQERWSVLLGTPVELDAHCFCATPTL